MSQTTKDAYRNIVLLCQKCGGDLVSVGQSTDSEPRYDCEQCGEAWVYTEAGWELVAASPRR